jgi:hypothetical protein
MDGFEAYQIYNAIKLHFTTTSYDFFKYNGKTNVSYTQFEIRKDRFFYLKLAKLYPDKDTLMFFIASNFFLRKKVAWVRDLLTDEARCMYMENLKVKESLMYLFKADLQAMGVQNAEDLKALMKVEDQQYPAILNLAIQGEIYWETIIVLNSCIGFFPVWSQKIADTILFPEYKLKCVRYAPFLGIEVKKFQEVLKTQLTNAK